ncbi:hypothetical protein PHYBLDRAFT_142930 [Phycomyces blakesleeanus NRRL 1555(-)]|uniref:Uncharacterized protein n=1 Tax=Phycomyces blakesleeanus (strain ATCC 8743b / DSM 1359 / FGSC 10004 / NBRC 33097 / NRRL 1555) TaxID=763407 RepID=A0A162PTW7_PHYB8|nr:hypothetical protein PHYBLDRAFT_142930 [Phycomyces blakesleeanus NRRL 1555(-)]OAD75947.1 hypothetical protein PHYBLDRAFT_142930 [Phycomyces blakesleeanus NRRL 1555(-)]|eukprot:XP_018293987.1 hypothetical protein PHYBLDRAFT_142930 [Phycomyces blakesleeanus NRRL 1555(-)]
MNNTNYTILQILQGMQETFFALQKGQEELQVEQDVLKKGQEALWDEQALLRQEIANICKDMNGQESPEQTINLGREIPRPVPNIKDITLIHIYRIMSHDLGVELDKKNKANLNTCTRLACNELASLPSVQVLGPNPNWSAISQEDRNLICIRHACLLRNNDIDFTRCHKNWASVAKDPPEVHWEATQEVVQMDVFRLPTFSPPACYGLLYNPAH